MRRLAFILCLLCACSDEVTYEAGTQITVRIQGSLAVQGADSLTIQVAPFVEGAFVAREPVDVSLSGLDWPVDLPVVPGKGQSKDARFEVVVRAVVATGAIAEARAVTNFVKGEQRVLTLNLIGCGEPPICESNASCRGTECLTCVAGRCEPTKETAGSTLPPFDPDRIPDNNPVEAVEDGSDAGPVDGDADTPGCVDDETTCQGDDAFVCRQGAFVLAEECANGCEAGACIRACEERALRCDELQPQRCDASGAWQDEGEACESLCEAGVCKQCQGDVAQCAGNTRQVCSAEGMWVDDRICRDLCSAGTCRTLSSCMDDIACGAAGQDSCCVSYVVEGGDYFRSYDGDEYPDRDFPARVSSFRLDKYEVTVGRFRRFMSYYATQVPPAEGAGRNPSNPDDKGWSASWNAFLPSAEDFEAQFAACADATWTRAPMGNENKPINCVSWYQAFAFCIWDQGRLPTEAEWNYAAAGGSEQRVFPWSSPPTSAELSEERATYYPASLAEVGATPLGQGKWGHQDLAGNVQEWTLDWIQEPYAITPCEDCAHLEPPTDLRVLRGGGFGSIGLGLKNGYRGNYPPELGTGKAGFRCARNE